MSARSSTACLLLLLAPALQAATLAVTVVDKDGRPVPDVAVLVRYLVQPAARPTPPAAVVIEQEKLRFRPYLTVMSPGTTVLFTNRDPFDHHIVATPPQLTSAPAKSFETRLPPDPAKPYAVKLDEPGAHALSCHIHSRMRGYVYVSDTPWFAKTDAQGLATFAGLPEGQIDVQTWHPEQFVAQAVQRSQLGVAPTALASSLNFTPRTRRAD